jgi:4-hydroxybenzoate polyprenyltransferase
LGWIPTILSIIFIYLTSCFIVSVYKKKNNKKFFKTMLWIGIIITIMLILLCGFIFFLWMRVRA